jgi:hypothetical protein
LIWPISNYLNMGYLRKKLERRTFSQDRYYILIKRQRAGKATFNELTELDDIVNRVPDIRNIVIRENFGDTSDEPDQPADDASENHSIKREQTLMRPSLWSRIRHFIDRIFFTSINLPRLSAF